ncbi:unnamed protein product [Cunninghamella echinulata]
MAMDNYDKVYLIIIYSVIGRKINNIRLFNHRPRRRASQYEEILAIPFKEKFTRTLLNGVDCAVFGLGDSSYRKFNYPAKKLYKRLQQLGANLIQTRGDGDDQHYQGLDGALLPWMDGLWKNIMEKYPLPENTTMIPDNELLPASFHMEFIDQVQEKVLLEEPPNHPGEFDMTVIENKRITADDHFQEVRHIVLRNDSSEFSYNPGDVAVITPQNLPNEVDGFLELMGWKELADKYIQFSLNDKDKLLPYHWPKVMTFRDLFTYHLDVFGVPRRSFFEMLSYFSTNEDHIERLREFISPEGQEDMWKYCQRPRRTIAEVLFDFKPLSIPFDYILDLFPPLHPRSFSIASSLKAHPHCMELCIAIVKYKTILKRIRRGVLTKWISTLPTGTIIKRVRIVKGTMNLPPPELPLIAIGPGTGVAPMRSFLEERISDKSHNNILFFGCRHKDKDFHYKQEWDDYANENKLKLFAAFSRDQDSKIYVQDIILQQSALVWDMIDEQQCKIVLSGSSGKMPEQVAYALKTVFMKEGGLTAEQAEEYFNNMNKTSQYQEECWS